MNRTAGGIAVSLLVHGSFIAMITLLNAAAGPERRLVAIDLGLLGTTARPGPFAPAPARPKPRLVPTVRPSSGAPDAVPAPVENIPQIRAAEASEENVSASTSVLNSGAAGAGSVVDDREGLQQVYVNEYFAFIRDRIVKNLHFPPSARSRGWSGKVSVSFVICKDGRVENVRIVQSTGFEVLDRNVIAAIMRASPFPKPPVEAELLLPIVYKLL